MQFSNMYDSITPPEWYRNVIFGVLAHGLNRKQYIDWRDRFSDTYENSVRKITTLYSFDFFSHMERGVTRKH